MNKILYAIVCLVVLALPFVMTTSPILRSFVLCFQVLFGIFSYLIHARNWQFNTRWWAFLYIFLSVLPILWFAVRMDALSAETAKLDPQSESRREELLKDPLLNLKGALALGSATFFIVGAITLLAHEYAKAFPSKQQFSKSSVKQLLRLASDFKWQFITVVAVIASVAVTVILLLVPNELWWLRVVVVVALFFLLFLILHDPRYIYRRFAVCMGLCLAGTQIGLTLFAKTPEVIVEITPTGEPTEEGQPQGGPRSVKIEEGTLLLHLSEPGWSFHICMTIVIVALLVADWGNLHVGSLTKLLP